MITHGSFLISSARSLAVIRTSVMAGLSCCGWCSRGESDAASELRQHLAKLLCGGGDDGDEIGFAKPALDAMTPEVAARAAMKHRRMRGRDRGVAKAQAQRHNAAPVAVVGVVGITSQRHRLLLEFGVQLPELRRLLRQIAVDVAERSIDLVHDGDAILDEAEN